MTRTSRALVVLAVLLAAAATLAGLTAGAASAEQSSYRDPADMGGASLNDVRRVEVVHGPARLTVRTGVTDLRRHSDAGPASLRIRIDTDPARSGPEYQLTTGLYSGMDYQLLKLRRGHPVGEPLSCRHRVRLAYDADVVRFWAADGCLGDPDRVRISLTMKDLYDGSHPVTDWLGRDGSWTGWVTAG